MRYHGLLSPKGEEKKRLEKKGNKTKAKKKNCWFSVSSTEWPIRKIQLNLYSETGHGIQVRDLSTIVKEIKLSWVQTTKPVPKLQLGIIHSNS